MGLDDSGGTCKLAVRRGVGEGGELAKRINKGRGMACSIVKSYLVDSPPGQHMAAMGQILSKYQGPRGQSWPVARFHVK